MDSGPPGLPGADPSAGRQLDHRPQATEAVLMYRRTVFVALLACLTALLAPLRAATLSPPILRNVHITSDTPLRRTDLPKVLGLVRGRPLDRHRLRQGIRALYAGGEVEGLAVFSEPAGPGQIDVTVRIRFRARIAHLRLRGIGLLWRSKVSSWLHIHKGDPFSATALEAGVRRVKRELTDRGYLDAVVDPDAQYNRRDNTVDVTITVHRNGVARVGRVKISGIDSHREELIEASRLKVGSRFSITRLDRAREGVEAKLRELGFWEGEVLDIDRSETANGLVVTIVVDPGPQYTLDLATVPDDEATRELVLKVLFGGPDTMPLHPAQLGLTTDWIRTRLQRKGYLEAKVTARLDRETTPRRFALRVEPGPRTRIEAVDFAGAGSIKHHALEKVVRVHKGKVAGLLRQKVDAET
ncbi:MAG TPA: hypothetical protein ENK19_02985, partial [Acidobacteria bacterium]|nr:hypothetical protein [Acidobacteriota bacterium]